MPMVIQTPDGRSAVVDKLPGTCPVCHSNIHPLVRYSKMGEEGWYEAFAEVLFECPNPKCREFFIGYYDYQMHLTGARPIEVAPLTFEEHAKETSAAFCEIYEQAHKAEQFGLTQICGVGYRKALEFLIKDYLVKKRPEKKADIEAKMLGSCIAEYVADQKVKDVAKRATWLGNDETHYQRRWVDKDLVDLKTLIRLTRHWIEAEHLTEEALKSMPELSKASNSGAQ